MTLALGSQAYCISLFLVGGISMLPEVFWGVWQGVSLISYPSSEFLLQRIEENGSLSLFLY